MAEFIRIEHLNKSYHDRPVLQDLSLSIPIGQITAVMAPSGVGKTTLLRILMGLETADSGKIEGLDGLRLSAVFQEDRLCANLSPVSNIRLVTGSSLSRQEILSALEQTGLSDCAGQPARELSGGQRRRVALLRALLAPWDLLLLDEPFKGLDTETRKQIMDYVLLHFHKKPGRTALLVTHDESEASYMAGNVFTLPGPL
ncbi:MAG TPA: ATP-binding cassette domain-containing protein [Candidatus Eisenbergiella stercoravium]|nr:ATP-binding cassette domain-containing protein [Candidatus Eisenbergiella stercoravium]